MDEVMLWHHATIIVPVGCCCRARWMKACDMVLVTGSACGSMANIIGHKALLIAGTAVLLVPTLAQVWLLSHLGAVGISVVHRSCTCGRCRLHQMAQHRCRNGVQQWNPRFFVAVGILARLFQAIPASQTLCTPTLLYQAQVLPVYLI